MNASEPKVKRPGGRGDVGVHAVDGEDHHMHGKRETFFKHMPTKIRGHIVAMLGEFIGTLLFLFFAFAGTQVANASSNNNSGTTVITKTAQQNPSQLLYIALSFGFSLAVNAWIFFRISGGLFNPAVTIGMFLIGSLTLVRTVLLFIVQILGGIAAAGIVSALFPGDLNVQTTLSSGTSRAQGCIIEMLLTAELVFTIFMLAAAKHEGNFVAPVGIGLSLFIAELVGVFWTGGSLNPARSLGPNVVTRSFKPYHWIYWVGPIAGSILAALFYRLFKVLEYETVNAGPDTEANVGKKNVGRDSIQKVLSTNHLGNGDADLEANKDH